MLKDSGKEGDSGEFYTSRPLISSNVLFFERGKQGSVWFYEPTASEGRKNYTKAKPIQP